MTIETTGALPVPPLSAFDDEEDDDEDEEDDDEDDEDEEEELEEELRWETALAGLSSTMKRMPLPCKVNSTTCFSRAAAKAAARAAPGSVRSVGEGAGAGGGAVVGVGVARAAAAADAGSSVAAESRAERRVVVFSVIASPSVSPPARQTGGRRRLLLLGRERGIDADGDDAVEEGSTLMMARIVEKLEPRGSRLLRPLNQLVGAKVRVCLL